MLTAINLPDRPPHPAYSAAVEAKGAARTLYISGQVGAAADGSVPAGVGDQGKQAIANLNAVLAAAGMTNANIAKLTIYLTDAAQMGDFYGAAFATLPSPPPATTLLVVKALADPALLVEIEAIAVG
ncbi:RidA family protein [Phenylobacterium sp.]|uniref:RidA family protein n=1 Tax=Phenylobacterium sp. TaxID=1871053 RepID=UPI00286CD887|nr:RidA family protein [Phenylobacterium sp.]